MTIYDIKPTWLRRIVIVPAALVLLPVGWVFAAADGIYEFTRDVWPMMKRAWRAR